MPDGLHFASYNLILLSAADIPLKTLLAGKREIVMQTRISGGCNVARGRA